MKKLLSLLLGISMTLALTSCGGDSNTDNNDGSTVEPENSRAFVAGNPSFNGEFMLGWTNSSYDNNVRELIDGNGGFFTPNSKGELVLASYLEDYDTEKIPNPSGEGEELELWSFKLKEGIKFSDGSDFTTEDVAFTYYLYADPSFISANGSGTYQPSFLYGFDEYYASAEAGEADKSLLGLNVVDDYNIEFTVAEPQFTIKSSFAYNMYSKDQMAPDGVIDVNKIYANYSSSPIGVGPYKIEKWNPGSDVQLGLNEYYTGNINGKKPSVEKIVVKMIPTETDIDMLLAGEIDLLQGQVQEEKIDAAKNNPGTTTNNYARHGFGHITWHTDFGATSHKEIREAIPYAFDKEKFVQLMTGKYGHSIAAQYSPNFWMIDEAWIEENIDPMTYDPSKAKEILENAGWKLNSEGIYEKNGEKAEIRIATGGSPWPDYLNNVLANTVEESGIKFIIDTVDFAVLLDNYYGVVPAEDRLYNGYALATSYTPEFDGYANNHSKFIYPYGGNSSSNSSRWNNPENDRLLEVMKNADSSTEEGKLEYQKAYQDWVKLTNKENPVLPLYANDYHDLYNADLENFTTTPLWEWPYAIVEANWK